MLRNQSWNPDTDGLPNEQYRWYNNHRVATFSDIQGNKWWYSIDRNKSEESYTDREKAIDALQIHIDTTEPYVKD